MANNSEEELTPLEKTVVKAYHVFSLVAFLLSLNTIVTATVAHTSILHGRFNELAETAYMLMKREFEFEFVSVRWSFLSSIFMFLGMVSSRMLIEFGLCKTCNQESMISCVRYEDSAIWMLHSNLVCFYLIDFATHMY